jgi:RNA polymerase sigma-32 factor
MGSKYSSSDLEFYTRRIRDFPLLSREDETVLANRYKQGDVEAGQKIVTANLRFVVKISRGYFHLGYRPLDIIQEGNMGLVKALTRYDPEKGVRFICYAIWWIKAYIKNYIYKSYRVHTGTLTHAKGLISLDCSLSNDGEEEDKLLDHMLDEGPDQEDTYVCKERRSFLLNLISAQPPILTNREIYIIKKRFFSDPPATLKDIAAKIGVTRERVRQIQARSLKRIKNVLDKDQSIMVEDIHIQHSYTVQRRKI